MKNMFRMVVVVALGLVGSGCSSLFKNTAPAHTFYSLRDLETREGDVVCNSAGHSASQARVLVTDATRSGFVNSQRIVFSRSPGTRAYYQYSSWTEPPPAALSTMLRGHLECAGLFSQVGSVESGTGADLRVMLKLVDFYHDASSTPGQAVVEVRVELVQLSEHKLIASKDFTRQVPAETYDAQGAAKALGAASALAVDDIVSWLSQSMSSLLSVPAADPN